MFFSAAMWNLRSHGKYSKIKVYVYNNKQLYWPVAHMQMVWVLQMVLHSEEQCMCDLKSNPKYVAQRQ